MWDLKAHCTKNPLTGHSSSFFFLFFFSLPSPLPYIFFFFSIIFLIKIPTFFTLPMSVECPAEVWKGAYTLLFTPLCCACSSLAHFLNNNPLALCAVFSGSRSWHLPCAPIKETWANFPLESCCGKGNLDQLSARKLLWSGG